jgi:hypothetical protein
MIKEHDSACGFLRQLFVYFISEKYPRTDESLLYENFGFE